MRTTASVSMVVALACLLASLFPARVSGQSGNPNSKRTEASPVGSEVPRTSFGRPDLGGVWDFATITPLERPAEFAGKEFLTEEDVRQLEESYASALR